MRISGLRWSSVFESAWKVALFVICFRNKKVMSKYITMWTAFRKEKYVLDPVCTEMDQSGSLIKKAMISFPFIYVWIRSRSDLDPFPIRSRSVPLQTQWNRSHIVLAMYGLFWSVSSLLFVFVWALMAFRPRVGLLNIFWVLVTCCLKGYRFSWFWYKHGS